MGGVYAIKNNINGKVYVGSTVDFKERRKHHFSDLRCGRHGNRHLQSSFNKHGESVFEFLILEEVVSEVMMADREVYWMGELNVHDKGHGYNISLDPTAPMRGRRNPSAGKKRPQCSGCKHHNSKLIEEDVRKIFRLHESGMKQTEIAKLFGIRQTNVSMILVGKTWSHVGIQPIAGRANNKSGCVGVYRHKSGKWISSIIIEGKYVNLGSYAEKQDAINARKKAEE